MTPDVHVCLPGTPRGGKGGLLYAAPPPPLHAIGWMGG